MRLRIVSKETKNYNNSNDEKNNEINCIRKNEITFGEIFTKIRLLRKRKTKRKLIIKRYRKNDRNFISSLSKIRMRRTLKSDENEVVEDTHIYNEYLSDSEGITNINSDEFKIWKEKHNNYFFPALNAPWQVRKVFRIMEECLGDFEKKKFLNLKFELWIYVNKPMILQDKVLDIVYGESKHKTYDKLVMGDLINIIKNLNSIQGYIKLIDYITEKREKMYRGKREYSIETDINILTSIKMQLNRYIIKDILFDEEIKYLKLKPANMVKKYRINNFIN